MPWQLFQFHPEVWWTCCLLRWSLLLMSQPVSSTLGQLLVIITHLKWPMKIVHKRACCSLCSQTTGLRAQPPVSPSTVSPSRCGPAGVAQHVSPSRCRPAGVAQPTLVLSFKLRSLRYAFPPGEIAILAGREMLMAAFSSQQAHLYGRPPGL